jgi:2-amino-4-hydroxy-6-hydroxymethyldihydropteridine diphosphokinase
MNLVFIALGSNIDKEKNLPLAIRLLAETCLVRGVSSAYETAPVGLFDQPNFLNAAVLVETELDAGRLKAEVLAGIENRLKRQRQTDKNAPRTIDADIILFNDQIFSYEAGDGSSRQIPDPDLVEFAHVAVPVAELAPQMRHPQTGEPLRDLARRLLAAATQAHGRAPLWKRPDIQLPLE